MTCPRPIEHVPPSLPGRGPSLGAPRGWLAALSALTLLLAHAGCSSDPLPPEDGVETVVVDPGAHVFAAIGETVRLRASAFGAGGSPLTGKVATWSSTDVGVARVDATGLVRAEGAGSATVSARVEGVTGAATVTVAQVVAGLELSPSVTTLESVSESTTLVASATDANGYPVPGAALTWASSDPGVATVGSTGVVTARKNGTTEITAAAPSVTATARVDVAQRAASLRFEVQPTDALSFGPFEGEVEVHVLDALGTPVADAASNVALALDDGGNGAELLGSATMGAVAGRAVFPDLAVDRAGTGYTLTASADGLPSSTSTPFDVDPSPFAYVADNAVASVSVLRVSDGAGVAVVPVGTRPYSVAVTPDGSHVYVTNGAANTVSVIETAGNTVVATVPVGQSPRGIAITPDGSTAVVSHGHLLSPYLVRIDTSTRAVVDSITVPGGGEGLAITPDGARAYLAAGAADAVAVADLATEAVTSVPAGDGPRRVALSADGSRAYATAYRSRKVMVIDTSTDQVVDSIPVGQNPVGIALTGDGTRAFVTHFPFSNDVTVIETATNTVARTIEVGQDPHFVAMGPYGTFAYVTQDDPSVVSEIDLATLQVVRTMPVGANPLGIVVALTDASR